MNESIPSDQNLGLNNLKFNQEAIFAVNSFVDPIESIRSEMASWSNFRLCRVDPIKSSRSDRVDLIRNGFLVKFYCLDLNWVQIGPKMAIFGPIFGPIFAVDLIKLIKSARSYWLIQIVSFVNSKFYEYLIIVFVNNDFIEF